MTGTTTGPRHDDAGDVGQVRQRARWWGAGTLVAVVVAVVVGFHLMGRQGERIDSLGRVVDEQNDLFGQVCRIAGGQVDVAPAAKHACERVERGEPAVPIPVTAVGQPGTDGTPGVGVGYTRQIDRCFIEVGLTNGATNRFGPFCGTDGAIGPTGTTGPPGPSGQSGVDGRPGVGIADVRPTADGCNVEVYFTDDRPPRVLGPFCGVQSFTMTGADGTRQTCARDGGDAASRPHYMCTVEPTPTSTAAPPPASTVLPTVLPGVGGG